HFPAIAAHAVNLDARRGLRHHDDARQTEPLCGQRDRLTVVAGRVGDNACGTRLGRQLRQEVAGAAHLERAHRLEIFTFESEIARCSDERRQDYDTADTLRSRLNVREADERGSSQFVAVWRGRANCWSSL